MRGFGATCVGDGGTRVTSAMEGDIRAPVRGYQRRMCFHAVLGCEEEDMTRTKKERNS